jgi:hypothetical protein
MFMCPLQEATFASGEVAERTFPANITFAGVSRDWELRWMSAHPVSAICRSTRDRDGRPVSHRAMRHVVEARPCFGVTRYLSIGAARLSARTGECEHD